MLGITNTQSSSSSAPPPVHINYFEPIKNRLQGISEEQVNKSLLRALERHLDLGPLVIENLPHFKSAPSPASEHPSSITLSFNHSNPLASVSVQYFDHNPANRIEVSDIPLNKTLTSQQAVVFAAAIAHNLCRSGDLDIKRAMPTSDKFTAFCADVASSIQLPGDSPDTGPKLARFQPTSVPRSADTDTLPKPSTANVGTNTAGPLPSTKPKPASASPNALSIEEIHAAKGDKKIELLALAWTSYIGNQITKKSLPLSPETFEAMRDKPITITTLAREYRVDTVQLRLAAERLLKTGGSATQTGEPPSKKSKPNPESAPPRPSVIRALAADATVQGDDIEFLEHTSAAPTTTEPDPRFERMQNDSIASKIIRSILESGVKLPSTPAEIKAFLTTHADANLLSLKKLTEALSLMVDDKLLKSHAVPPELQRMLAEKELLEKLKKLLQP